MLLDNENEKLKVHEWISKYTEDGTLDIVTGICFCPIFRSGELCNH